MQAKRIHILGAGLWQVPTIRLAKSLGYLVLVTDMYETRPGYEYADSHEVIDVRDMKRTLDAARRFRADGIICDTTDVGVPTAAYVAEQLGLPGIGYDTALRFTNKYLMRQKAALAGIRNPRFALVRAAKDLLEAARHVGYPLAVKPVDGQSSRGVRKIEDEDALSAAFDHALEHTSKSEVLLEEWLDGIEVTVEGFAYQGTPHVLGISDKEHYPGMPQVASRLTYPPAFDKCTIERIRDTNAGVVRALGLRTGVTHAEYIVTRDGEVFLVEIAARGGGSRLYSHIAPFLSGIDLPRLYLEFCLGSTQKWPVPNAEERAAVLDFFDFPCGTVRSIRGVNEAAKIPGVADLAVELCEGQYFGGAGDDRSRPGYVVVFGSTRKEVLAKAADVRARIEVEIA